MTLVSRELGRISQTLGRGISGLGQARLAGEQSKRRSAELDYRLGRNREYDERATEEWAARKPVQELAGLKAQTELDREASYDEEVSDPFTAYMKTQWLPGIAKHYNAKIDTAGDQTRLVLPDGSILKDVQRDKAWEAGHILSKYKLSSTYKDQIARIEEKEQTLNEQGIPITDPAYAKLADNKYKAQTALDSPEQMIQGLRNQIDQLERSGHYPGAIKRIKGEIKDQEAKLMTPEQKALYDKQMKLLDIKLETAKGKGKYGGVTRYQYEQLVRKDRDFARQSQKDQLALIATIIDEYDVEFKNEMAGTYLKGRPSKFKYIQQKIAERAAIIKGEGAPGEAQGEQTVSVNQKTGIVRIKYPDGKVEYYNQNKERVTEEGNPLAVGKIKQ